MLFRIIALCFIVQSSYLVASDLYKAKELSIEEQESSIDGTHLVRKKFKVGEVYVNNTKKPAKFFLGDEVGGSISSGGEITLNKVKSKTSSIKLSVGVARFRVKTLKSEAFEVRTPSAVAGVRGTAFSIYLDGNNEKITLPEGQLEIIKDDKSLSISAGEKVTVKEGELQNSEKMSASEMSSEMDLILGDVRYRNIKLDKALESYDKKVKEYKDKIKNSTKKESEKVQKVIDSEIKKSEKSGDIKMIDELERVKENLNFRTRNLKVMKSLNTYHQYVDKAFSKYQPYLNREHAKIEKAFKDEIKKSIKKEDKNTARDLDTWMNSSFKGSKVFSRYFAGKSRQIIQFEDGLSNIAGQKASYKLEGNKLTISVIEGPYKGWTDIWETRDDGKSYRCIIEDVANKMNKQNQFSFGKAEKTLIALYADIRNTYESPNGEVWRFSESTVSRDDKEFKFELKNHMLTIISDMGPIMLWETRDGGRSFRLIRTKTNNSKFEESRIILKATE